MLLATAKATVPQNNVYLYDGTNSGVHDAQRLILAQDATLTTTVTAKALFTETGSLVVRKSIAGPAAGQQGAVTINVRCGADPGVLVGDPFDIPAGSTGTTSKRYDNIPVGTTVHRHRDPRRSLQSRDSRRRRLRHECHDHQPGSKTVDITDTYNFVEPSLLVVKKSIQGPGAGQQGEVVIQPTCDGQTWIRSRSRPARPGNRPRPTRSAPGSACTITETIDGHTSTVTVTVDGSGQTGHRARRRQRRRAVLTDTYELVPGSLTVTKTIAGAAAGQQGADHDQRELQRERHRHSAARLHHRGRGRRRFDVEDLPRHPGRVDLHRHRDRDGRHEFGDDHDHRRQRASR